ncbi:GNAT family N-acetyltransferase [soil metagenome]
MTTVSTNIRLFTENDYEVVAQLWNAAYPYKTTADELRRETAKRPEHLILKRYVLEQNGSPVGYGSFQHSEDSFHPQKFWLGPVMPPAHQGKGYGKALFEHLLKELEPYKPTELRDFSREDWTRKNRFLSERGFEEESRSFESRLDVAACDLTNFVGLEEALAAQGLEVKTYADLAHDPARNHKIYDLHTTLDLDVPMTGEYTKPTFERFASYHWEDERFVPEGYLVAVAGDEYVGLSELFVSQADDKLHTGLTGVRREQRRKGVALSLKVAGARFAQTFGAPEINTWNESNNAPMLAINERLGFVRQPANIDFVKKIGS